MICALNGVEPLIEEGAFVAANATVIGQVTIRKQSSVWYGAVLRGDLAPIVVGEGANIQDNSVLHTDFGQPVHVGEGVTVGHNVTLHGCRIAAHALVGMNATLLNGSQIGEGALVAAQSLVPEGKVIEARQMVRGVPAKVAGHVSDEQFQKIKDNALLYRQLAEQHRRVDGAGLRDDGLLKLAVFVPPAELETLKTALFAAGAGNLGRYSQCSWQVLGQGNFLPAADSQPAVGEPGSLARIDEYRLEVLVPRSCLAAVMRALFAVHPYETPAFDLWPIFSAAGD